MTASFAIRFRKVRNEKFFRSAFERPLPRLLHRDKIISIQEVRVFHRSSSKKLPNFAENYIPARTSCSGTVPIHDPYKVRAFHRSNSKNLPKFAENYIPVRTSCSGTVPIHDPYKVRAFHRSSSKKLPNFAKNYIPARTSCNKNPYLSPCFHDESIL